MLIDRGSNVWSGSVMLCPQFRPMIPPSSKLKAQPASTHSLTADSAYAIAPDVIWNFAKRADAKRFLESTRINRGSVRHRLAHRLQGSLHDAVDLLLTLEPALDAPKSTRKWIITIDAGSCEVSFEPSATSYICHVR